MAPRHRGPDTADGGRGSAGSDRPLRAAAAAQRGATPRDRGCAPLGGGGGDELAAVSVTKINQRDAINEAIRLEMGRDARVICVHAAGVESEVTHGLD